MKRHAGFTLVELLVTIATVAILATLVVLGTRLAIDRARGVLCINQLREISTGLTLYAHENGGRYPARDINPGVQYGRWSDVLQQHLLHTARTTGTESERLFTDPLVSNHFVFGVGGGLITDYGVNTTVIVARRNRGVEVLTRLSEIIDPYNTVLVATAQRGDDATTGNWKITGDLSAADDWKGVADRPAARLPGKRSALAFCDGHIETPTWDILTRDGQRRFQLRYDRGGPK